MKLVGNLKHVTESVRLRISENGSYKIYKALVTFRDTLDKNIWVMNWRDFLKIVRD